jgi:hypothetical protein
MSPIVLGSTDFIGLGLEDYLRSGQHRLEKGLGNACSRGRQWCTACGLVSGPQLRWDRVYWFRALKICCFRERWMVGVRG